jgi:hypothetical protein
MSISENNISSESEILEKRLHNDHQRGFQLLLHTNSDRKETLNAFRNKKSSPQVKGQYVIVLLFNSSTF